MALQASGQIDFSDINVELGLTATAQLSLGSGTVRALYGVPSGAIRLGADGYGKSNAFVPTGVTTAGAPFYYDFTNTADSWTAGGATITTAATYLTINSTSTDPLIRRTVSFSGAKYPYVQANIFRTTGSTWDGKVFYSTSGHGESALYYNQMTEPTWDGVNYQWITVDMRSLVAGGTDWTNNTITNLRLDFGLTSTDDFRLNAVVVRGTIYPVAGFAQYTQFGYFNDDPAFFTAPTLEGATNTVVINNAAETTSYQWLGYFLPPTTGNYTFTTSSDDASYVWIGADASAGYTTANAIVNNGGLHGAVPVTSGNVTLTAGTYYPIRIQYGNNAVVGGANSMVFSFTGPGIVSTSNGAGYFFYNGDTTGI